MDGWWGGGFGVKIVNVWGDESRATQQCVHCGEVISIGLALEHQCLTEEAKKREDTHGLG